MLRFFFRTETLLGAGKDRAEVLRFLVNEVFDKRTRSRKPALSMRCASYRALKSSSCPSNSSSSLRKKTKRGKNACRGGVGTGPFGLARVRRAASPSGAAWKCPTGEVEYKTSHSLKKGKRTHSHHTCHHHARHLFASRLVRHCFFFNHQDRRPSSFSMRPRKKANRRDNA